MNLPRFFTIAALLLGATGCNRTDYSWESDLQHRLAIDLCRTRAEGTEYIHKYIPEANDSMITAWTNSGKLESQKTYVQGKTPTKTPLRNPAVICQATNTSANLYG